MKSIITAMAMDISIKPYTPKTVRLESNKYLNAQMKMVFIYIFIVNTYV